MLDNKKILKTSILNHLKNFKWTLFAILIYYLIIFLIFGDNIFSLNNSLNIMMHLWIVIPLMVVFYIHLSYFIENKNTFLKVDNNSLIDLKNNIIIKNSDIHKIIINKSFSMSIGKIPFFPNQHYKYCEVILKNGNKIILTSLLKVNIDDYLKENLKGVVYDTNFSPFFFFLRK